MAATDRDGDGIAEIITAPGPGGKAPLRRFDNLSLAAIDSLFAEVASFGKGLFVAGSDTT
ncbi:MAG: hypothetical protein L0Y71_24100 [Gemmataceae bacterium]|nr:hypothetical protein [Gemmataceae bacterium]